MFFWAHFCREFRWQEREAAVVVEAVTEVFNHGRVEDGEVWTSLKRNNWGIEKEILLSHTAVGLFPCPQRPWAVSGDVGAPCRTLKCGKELSHLFPYVLYPFASPGSRFSRSLLFALLFLQMAQPHWGALKKESAPKRRDWLQPTRLLLKDCFKIWGFEGLYF